MKKFTLFIVLIIKLLLADNVSAKDSVAYKSADLATNVSPTDTRSIKLNAYLQKHNSPLAEYADEFITQADKYSLDWRLVAAISGVESTFGKRIPQGSYNAYGWANGNYTFDSWSDSINIVTKTLKENYVDRGALSIAQIARIYAPPSDTWSYKVKYFMKQIESYPLEYSL